ncbi:redoxin domain-containing protein [Ferruginibacter sp. SUN106]|uniref:redoxin domain-containing protein n=1 Tax=Ferruginibacter sp. SUN106 TaxID=2978348 RepID=UPI003D363D07
MKILTAIAILISSSLFTTSIYIKQFTTLNGTQVSMAQYQGKKILLVNIASNSEYAATQIPQLEQLYQQYKDSVVVVAFPSNDFGNESRNDADLKLLLQDTYHTNFPVSIRTGVKDSTGNTHAIYHWLQNQSENGNMNVKVKKDFQKYLIDKDGTIIGVFSAKTNPLDNTIINAITQ